MKTTSKKAILFFCLYPVSFDDALIIAAISFTHGDKTRLFVKRKAHKETREIIKIDTC